MVGEVADAHCCGRHCRGRNLASKEDAVPLLSRFSLWMRAGKSIHERKLRSVWPLLFGAAPSDCSLVRLWQCHRLYICSKLQWAKQKCLWDFASKVNLYGRQLLCEVKEKIMTNCWLRHFCIFFRKHFEPCSLCERIGEGGAMMVLMRGESCVRAVYASYLGETARLH